MDEPKGMPAGVDIVVRPGVDFRQELPLVAPDGMPRSLVGWTVEGVVRARHGSPPVFSGELRHRTGIAVLEIPGVESAAWTFGVGRYELAAVGPQGQLDVPLAGRVLVDRR